MPLFARRWEATLFLVGLLSLIVGIPVAVFSASKPSVIETLVVTIPVDVAMLTTVIVATRIAKRVCGRSFGFSGNVTAYEEIFRPRAISEAVKVALGRVT